MKENRKYKEIIPIMCVCSDTYTASLAVTIQSISDNANKEYLYKIYILHSSNYNLEKAKLMSDTLADNIEINFINAEEKGDTIPFSPFRQYSKEINYKLVFPHLIQEYDQYIYLDSDLVVLTDLSELHHTNLESFVLGAVKENVGAQLKSYIVSRLKIDPDTYINSGVIIFNRKKYMEQEVWEKCIKMESDVEPFKFKDQDYLSVICQGQIKYLDIKYNVRRSLPKAVIASIKEPHIIHYLGQQKPWNCPNIYLQEYFWKYAERTKFYEELRGNLK